MSHEAPPYGDAEHAQAALEAAGRGYLEAWSELKAQIEAASGVYQARESGALDPAYRQKIVKLYEAAITRGSYVLATAVAAYAFEHELGWSWALYDYDDPATTNPRPFQSLGDHRKAWRYVTVWAERYRLAHGLAEGVDDAPLLGARSAFTR